MDNPGAYRQIHASCHCGTVRVRLEWPEFGLDSGRQSKQAIPVRACGCALCTKHKAVWTSHPEGRFHLSIADPAQVKRYRFGTKTADFHVCQTCGVMPIVTCTIDGTPYAVVNVNTFDDVDRAELVETATDFEGETTEDRLARRRRNWTPGEIAVR